MRGEGESEISCSVFRSSIHGYPFGDLSSGQVVPAARLPMNCLRPEPHMYQVLFSPQVTSPSVLQASADAVPVCTGGAKRIVDAIRVVGAFGNDVGGCTSFEVVGEGVKVT